eukprot:CAMPEP_0184490928 /NCGR_PEP_ID=MMETSP0113_2-20130426/19237_1 /TAXON_ID=91329 /ORGANISM="Norrisiella sphaerica, Strain BC52" /LENGTH=768 /DNA_ID=CAMNT_0026875067 /DNA_START=132 /DNA_END=2438 /DNA_ORIENTATION=+
MQHAGSARHLSVNSSGPRQVEAYLKAHDWKAATRVITNLGRLDPSRDSSKFNPILKAVAGYGTRDDLWHTISEMVDHGIRLDPKHCSIILNAMINPQIHLSPSKASSENLSDNLSENFPESSSGLGAKFQKFADKLSEAEEFLKDMTQGGIAYAKSHFYPFVRGYSAIKDHDKLEQILVMLVKSGYEVDTIAMNSLLAGIKDRGDVPTYEDLEIFDKCGVAANSITMGLFLDCLVANNMEDEIPKAIQAFKEKGVQPTTGVLNVLLKHAKSKERVSQILNTLEKFGFVPDHLTILQLVKNGTLDSFGKAEDYLKRYGIQIHAKMLRVFITGFVTRGNPKALLECEKRRIELIRAGELPSIAVTVSEKEMGDAGRGNDVHHRDKLIDPTDFELQLFSGILPKEDHIPVPNEHCDTSPEEIRLFGGLLRLDVKEQQNTPETEISNTEDQRRIDVFDTSELPYVDLEKVFQLARNLWDYDTMRDIYSHVFGGLQPLYPGEGAPLVPVNENSDMDRDITFVQEYIHNDNLREEWLQELARISPTTVESVAWARQSKGGAERPINSLRKHPLRLSIKRVPKKITDPVKFVEDLIDTNTVTGFRGRYSHTGMTWLLDFKSHGAALKAWKAINGLERLPADVDHGGERRNSMVNSSTVGSRGAIPCVLAMFPRADMFPAEMNAYETMMPNPEDECFVAFMPLPPEFQILHIRRICSVFGRVTSVHLREDEKARKCIVTMKGTDALALTQVLNELWLPGNEKPLCAVMTRQTDTGS